MLVFAVSMTMAINAFATDTKIRFGYILGNPAAALVAQELGYFKDEGIEVELIPVQSGPAAVAATASGAVDASFGDVLAWGSGLANGFTQVKLILPGTHGATSRLLVSKGSQLRTPADFIGKRIGVPPPSMITVSLKVWLARAGVDINSVKFVIIPNSGDGNALARGDVDAVVTFEPATTRLVLEQGAVPLLDPTLVGPPADATFTAYYANDDFLKRDPKAAERFINAIRRGAKKYGDLPRLEAVAIRGKYSGIDLINLSHTVPGLIERMDLGASQLSSVNLRETQAWVDRAVTYGGVPRPVDISPYVTPSAFEASLK
ncbi:ABC transporter substrate-binding protein [Pseudomonas sp. RGM2987]|uniref:ABC transporter substrate-binding protein n=1 Tax=Pseudomonas sp. RGM2987 TaxID=2930090 RepID=UPI001FD662C6|nr:ABC transporter substrate-binding protein [Pseudomonas sp. RGM2987]MCJ8207517.1 ABC transporter substrate-binding protein [Pseudomonas sp. RGM2987]